MTTTTDIATPYIYIDGQGDPWFFYPAADEADESEVKLWEVPTAQVDAILAHGFRVVMEGFNDDDTLAF